MEYNNKKLKEITKNELAAINGGMTWPLKPICPGPNPKPPIIKIPRWV